jgi:hypothetical protein
VNEGTHKWRRVPLTLRELFGRVCPAVAAGWSALTLACFETGMRTELGVKKERKSDCFCASRWLPRLKDMASYDVFAPALPTRHERTFVGYFQVEKTEEEDRAIIDARSANDLLPQAVSVC